MIIRTLAFNCFFCDKTTKAHEWYDIQPVHDVMFINMICPQCGRNNTSRQLLVKFVEESACSPVVHLK